MTIEMRGVPEPVETARGVPDAGPTTPVDGSRPQRRAPMSRLRRRIAQRLLEARASQALVTTFNEVDLAVVQELRERYNTQIAVGRGPKLGIMPFFVKAAIEALRRVSVVNARIDGDEILYHDYYDIGVAVSTDRGLIVPILRHADRRSLSEIDRDIAACAGRARSGKITMEELAGGTFTITNGGVFGSLLSTPIVSPPQSAVLGMHKIQQRPVVIDGGIVIRPMMYLALTYDHRLIDGREAVEFLSIVKGSLEVPRTLLRNEVHRDRH